MLLCSLLWTQDFALPWGVAWVQWCNLFSCFLTSTLCHFGRWRRKMRGNGCHSRSITLSSYVQIWTNFNTKAITFLGFLSQPSPFLQKKPTNKKYFSALSVLIPNLIWTLKCFHCIGVDHNEDDTSLLCRSDFLKMLGVTSLLWYHWEHFSKMMMEQIFRDSI